MRVVKACQTDDLSLCILDLDRMEVADGASLTG
jgi:hypothetical protein